MAQKQPDAAAKIIGHLVVGVIVGWITARLAKEAAPAVVLGFVAMIIHAELDGPVSQALGELGI